MPRWVDNEFYFGPDRRRRDAGKRWSDRRHLNDAADPPSLGIVLRRLRVMSMDLSAPDDRRRATQLINLALIEADQRGLRACADAIKEAGRYIAQGEASRAESCITQAMNLADGGAP